MDAQVTLAKALQTWLEPFEALLPHPTRQYMFLLYIEGLIKPGDRKSLQPIAARLDPGEYGNLRHFVSASPWNEAPLEAELLAQADRLVGGPDATLVIDDTPLPKKGTHSVGVARQYASALDRQVNCQILVSLTLIRDAVPVPVPVPVALRLFLPPVWTHDPERMQHAGVPAALRAARSKSEIALAELDRVRAAGLRFGTILADVEYGVSTAFRQALSERGLLWVVGIPHTQEVFPADEGPVLPTAERGRPRQTAVPDLLPVTAEHMLAGTRWKATALAKGIKAPPWPKFAAVRVRVTGEPATPLNADANQRAPGEEAWLVGEQQASGKRWYYLSNLPSSATLRALAATIETRRATEQARQQLKEELGLSHFEGRSWRGLHRHTLMALIAFAFLQHHPRLLTPARLSKVGIIEVPRSRWEEYECGALLFAYLAYPEPDAETQRDEILRLFCHMAIRRTISDDPSSAYIPRMIKPAYLWIQPQEVPRIMNAYDRRVFARYGAAAMAIPFLKEMPEHDDFEFPKEYQNRTPSIMMMAELAIDRQGDKTPSNIISRKWTPSLPVIHLALAIARFSYSEWPEMIGVQTADILLHIPGFIEFVVGYAEKHEGVFARTPQLRTAWERMLRFRLT